MIEFIFLVFGGDFIEMFNIMGQLDADKRGDFRDYIIVGWGGYFDVIFFLVLIWLNVYYINVF